jgi:hypothetical protein
MALEKIKVVSPDLIVKRADYSEAALAKIAHVNFAITQITDAVSNVGVLGTTTALTATTVAPLRAQVEDRLDAIEAKLDALIKALS